MRTCKAIVLGVSLPLIAAVSRANALGGFSLSGASGIQASPGSNLALPVMTLPIPTPMHSGQRFHQLSVVGDVGLKESDLPPHATIVRLHVDGHDVYMRLDTELGGPDLQFDPNAAYARELYRAIMVKRIEVVGQQELRDRILASATKKDPVKITGYVFDRANPYFVVKSVSIK